MADQLSLLNEKLSLILENMKIPKDDDTRPAVYGVCLKINKLRSYLFE